MTSETAVMFDLGDVLVKLRFERGLRRFAALSGCTQALSEDAMRVYMGETAHAYYAGAISTAAFFKGLAKRLGCENLRHEEMVAAWCDIFDPWPEMERLAEQVIDAGHPTYLLSNTEPLHFEHLRRQIPVLSRFSDLHLSYEVRLVKPDPAYYRAALECFSLEPARCVFVDDRLENVEAARAVGIPAVQQRGDVEEIRRFLRQHGVGI